MQLCSTVLTLSRSSSELTRVSRQGTQLAIRLSRHTAHVRDFSGGTGISSPQALYQNMNSSTALLLRYSLRPGRALPCGEEGLPFPKAWPDVLFPYLSSSERIKGWCHLCFRLPSVLKNIKEKERCVLLSSPAAASDVRKLSPSESKCSQSSCSSSPEEGQAPGLLSPVLPGLSAIRLCPSHSLPSPTPAFILLMQIY